MTSKSAYKKILAPIDFSESSRRTVEKALELQKFYSADLIIANFVTPISSTGIVYSAGFLDIEAQLLEDAREEMNQVCQEYSIPLDKTIIDVSYPKKAILMLSKKQNIDLIVLGSHGHHHFLGSILGSTANAVSSHAHCDVLLVK